MQKLDEPPDARGVKEEVALVRWSYRLQSFWNSSPYYLKDVGPESKHSVFLNFSHISHSNRKHEHRQKQEKYFALGMRYIGITVSYLYFGTSSLGMT